MRAYRFTARFEKSFARLPDDAAELFINKKLPLLLSDMWLSSLRAKKMLSCEMPGIINNE